MQIFSLRNDSGVPPAFQITRFQVLGDVGFFLPSLEKFVMSKKIKEKSAAGGFSEERSRVSLKSSHCGNTSSMSILAGMP